MAVGLSERRERIEAGPRRSERGWVGVGWSSDSSVATWCCDCVALDSMVPVDGALGGVCRHVGLNALSVSRGEKKKKKKKARAKMIFRCSSLSSKV